MITSLRTPVVVLGLTLMASAPGCSGDSDATEGSSSGSSATSGDPSETTGTAGGETGTGEDPTTTATTVTTTTTATTATTATDDGGSATTGAGESSGSETTEEDPPLEPFSFFVTSLVALQDLSGSAEGFGGDLRFGEEGMGAGLRGADKICATIAERSMPGAGKKQWRAFLSAVQGEDGEQVNAIDRVGEGPWYDRLGRVFAGTKADLLTERPTGIDAAIKDDFPNEDGVPNHQPNPVEDPVDNHDTLTGSNEKGELYSATATCNSWTGNTGDEGRPRVGHSWPRYGMGMGGGGGGGGMGDGSAANWMSSLDESGCAPGVSLIEMGPPQKNAHTVGSGGGYGGFYCFALTP